MDEYEIVLASGQRLYTGGFDTTATLYRSIDHQWRRKDHTDYSIGIHCGRQPEGNGKLTLINPDSIEAIIDLRPEEA